MGWAVAVAGGRVDPASSEVKRTTDRSRDELTRIGVGVGVTRPLVKD